MYEKPNIRDKNIQNLVENYAKRTYARNVKSSLDSHAKDYKVYVKPKFEARLDRNYRSNLNNYIK